LTWQVNAEESAAVRTELSSCAIELRC